MYKHYFKEPFMPIVKLTPEADPVVELYTPAVQKETYLGIAADNDKTPIHALEAYLEGMPWTVQYYSQLIGKHNDLREVDPGQNAAFQQYQKIIDLQLRVETSLQASYDSEQSITSVTGSAIIVHVVPNLNDHFVASAGSRQDGLFRVKTVERRTFNRGSVYHIDYELVGYIGPDNELWTDLESKVVRKYQFSMQRLAEGLAPVLREEVYARSKELAHEQDRILRHYFGRFFNRSLATLMVPGQTNRVYDPRLVNFLMAIVDTEVIPECRELRTISLDHDRYLAAPSLLTALLSRDPSEIDRSLQKAGMIHRLLLNQSSWLKGAVYWPVDEYVYPETTTLEEAIGRDPMPLAWEPDLLEASPKLLTPEWVTQNQYRQAGELLPLIKPVTVDAYYILSESFYAGLVDLSVLEILIRDYLNQATLDQEQLIALTQAYFSWPVVEQFYYGPLLVLLIRESVRGFYR